MFYPNVMEKKTAMSNLVAEWGHDCRVFCNRNIFYGIYLFPVPFLAVEVVEYPEIYFRKIFFRILREYA